MMKKFSDFNIKVEHSNFEGEKIKITNILNTQITVIDYKIEPSKQKENTELLTLQIEWKGIKRIVFTGSKMLSTQIKQIEKTNFPFTATIISGDGDRYEFC